MKNILRVALLAALASACSSIRLGKPDRRAQTEKRMLQLSEVMEKFRQATGAYPQDPAQLAAQKGHGSAYAAEGMLTDEWGHPYKLELVPAGKMSPGQVDYKIISAGEDGQFGTADDAVFSHRKR